MLSRLLRPKAEAAFSVLRIAAGLMFSFHGMQKLFGVLSTFQPPFMSQLWFGGVIELACGLAIAAGALTSWAAFLASGTMAVAYLQFHWKLALGSRFFPAVNKGELALLYSFLFLFIACHGGGRFSVDAMRAAGRREKSAGLSIPGLLVRRHTGIQRRNRMRVMVLVKASKESEAGVLPGEELLTAMGKFNEELVKAGVLLAGEGLDASAKGARVRFAGTKRTVVDGPFAEAKELVAGFWIWQVKSMEEAIEWAKRCPNPQDGGGELEIRRIFESEDFGPALTPELREAEERLRAETDAKR